MAIRDLQILLIEDDTHIRSILTTALAAAGAIVIPATRGKDAHRIASESKLDLVLLDLGLPDMDGVALIPLLQQACDAPIIVISARFQEQQKVAALDAGADDYLTKPFGIDELQARMRSTLRRSGRATPRPSRSRYEHQGLSVDFDTHQVCLAGKPVHLTPLEFRLLAVLVRQAGKVITHRQLLREVWGPHHEEDDHYLRIYMRQLRSKLEANPAQPRFLLNEPGVGYRLFVE
ncbi:MAG: response regulator [Moraxellaceae bacterium]|jgi:two-component system KDP operon response regulator KdpE|nr:response regulator [Moraxellaceae bacterium]MDF3029738.1 response regulator [Moraxellaceae bacterium]